MSQNFLFNLPQVSTPSKSKNKSLVDKAKAPKKPSTKAVRNTGNALRNKVNTVLEGIRGKLKDESNEYEYITDSSKIRAYFKKIKEKGIAAIDFEADGVDPVASKLAGVCLYVEGEKAIYIPFGHYDFNNTLIEGQADRDLIIELLEDTLNIKWILHNADYDIRISKWDLGLSDYLNVYWDTMIAGKLLNENESHRLKELWTKYCGKGSEADTFDKLFQNLGFNILPYQDVYIYAAKDAKLTMELFRFQEKFLDPSKPLCKERDLEETGRLLMDIELPLIKVVASMEDSGICIDDSIAKPLSEKYNQLLDNAIGKAGEVFSNIDLSNLSSELRGKLSTPINISSPTQLAIIFYDCLGMKSPDRRSPRGTGADIIDGLREKYKEYENLFTSIIEVRKVSKLVSTYIDKLPISRAERTNKIHTNYNQIGAVTGRFSSTGPNLQNIPSRGPAKEIRKMFCADEGYVLVGADYSQQEPRVLAHLLLTLFKDSSMADAYAEGRDLYSWMASEVYGVPYEECKEFLPDGTKNPEGKVRRDSVKSILLGLMYGRGVDSVGEQLGVSSAEAQKIFDMVYDKFPSIKAVVEYFIKTAKETGFVKTIYGRKRRLTELLAPTYDLVFMNNKSQSETDSGIRAYFLNRYINAYGRAKRDEVKKEANERGYWIVDNSLTKSEAERQCLNSVIQGSSADITKKAMVDIYNNKRFKEIGARLLLTVHDEVISEAPIENAIEAARLMEEIMINATKERIVVGMKVDAEIMKNWAGEDLTKQIEEGSYV